MTLEKLILTCRFVSVLTFFSIQSILFIYLKEKGLSVAAIACAFSIMTFSSKFFSILAGSLGDRFGTTKMILLGCFLDLLAYMGFFFTNARALLLALGGKDFQKKTHLQGQFAKASNLAVMIAPLLSFIFIAANHVDIFVMGCVVIEATVVIMMFRGMRNCICGAKFLPQHFSFAQYKTVFTKPFLLLHLILFIPEGISSALYTIVPYYFTQVLNQPELIPFVIFVNGLVAVLTQNFYSKKIDFTLPKLSALSVGLTILLIGGWFMALAEPSVPAAYLYVVLFALISLFTQTAINNTLVRLDDGTHRGATYGVSRVVFSLTTTGVINVLPLFFLV